VQTPSRRGKVSTDRVLLPGVGGKLGKAPPLRLFGGKKGEHGKVYA